MHSLFYPRCVLGARLAWYGGNCTSSLQGSLLLVFTLLCVDRRGFRFMQTHGRSWRRTAPAEAESGHEQVPFSGLTVHVLHVHSDPLPAHRLSYTLEGAWLFHREHPAMLSLPFLGSDTESTLKWQSAPRLPERRTSDRCQKTGTVAIWVALAYAL